MTADGELGNHLERFNQIFFEECAEHLAEMEQILLALETRGPDDEELNAIFRVAHSIKGSAGIFGFHDMTVVTHTLESLLDRIRAREIPFAPEMVDLFLQAADVISMQLAGHRDHTPVREERVEEMRRRLQEVIESSLGPQALPAAPREVISAGACDGVQRRVRIVLSASDDLFQRGIRLEGLIDELKELGELRTRGELAELPPLPSFDPERCITRWEFLLDTSASTQQVLDAFLFVAEEEQLTVQELPLPPGAEPPPPPQGSPDTAPPGASGRRAADGDSSIRVNTEKVDQLINQVGELLITQGMLLQNAAALDPVRHQELFHTLVQLERNSRDLQQSVMSIRLVPIGVVFSRFPRMVRDVAARLGKEVQLKTVGGATELDKGLIEKIADPLAHLVRNALDHGLESPQARVAAGKERAGTIEMRASQVGGRIVIEVSDDGAGLNRERILARASEKGIATSAEMSDEEVWQLIFAPGFSTAEAVTDISGRGVGMDVVLQNVQGIGGRVQVSSRAGRGATVTITLPLTLAILDGLCVAAGEEKFVIPLSSVLESVQAKRELLRTINGSTLVEVRGDYLPLLRLHELFEIEPAPAADQGVLVLVEADGQRGALLVDALLDERQVVVKSIESNFRKVQGSAGATILGDGRVSLILDVAELLLMHGGGTKRGEGGSTPLGATGTFG